MPLLWPYINSTLSSSKDRMLIVPSRVNAATLFSFVTARPTTWLERPSPKVQTFKSGSDSFVTSHSLTKPSAPPVTTLEEPSPSSSQATENKPPSMGDSLDSIYFKNSPVLPSKQQILRSLPTDTAYNPLPGLKRMSRINLPCP